MPPRTPPRKDKGARARANDDEGAQGGNSAVDKDCALGGGQSKDNSGGGVLGGGGGEHDDKMMTRVLRGGMMLWIKNAR